MDVKLLLNSKVVDVEMLKKRLEFEERETVRLVGSIKDKEEEKERLLALMKVMDDEINKEVQRKRELEAVIGDLEMQWEL